jgi:FkbM family methyltransferase
MAAEGDVDRVVQEKFFPGRPDGLLVEVGAARPDHLSISMSFRALGWKVISIEPNPAFCAEHRTRGNDVLQFACSDEDADGKDFFIVDMRGAIYENVPLSYESMSSLGIKDGFAEQYEEWKSKTSLSTIKVSVRKLDTLLRTYAPQIQEIDVLAIDVEGWELDVLRGFSIEHYRPKVVILENLFEDPAYDDYILARGHERWQRLHFNDVYVLGGFSVRS